MVQKIGARVQKIDRSIDLFCKRSKKNITKLKNKTSFLFLHITSSDVKTIKRGRPSQADFDRTINSDLNALCHLVNLCPFYRFFSF